jgi:predicted N-acetyltransferase YhbS
VGIVTPPKLLSAEDDLSLFDCGNSTLNEWLQKRALKNQGSGASRSFVICEGKKVVGYYAIASGSIERLNAPKSISRNMPEPIPVIILGRLAVDMNYQGQKLGAALFKDAILRTLSVSNNLGVRALLVHTISEQAQQFYLSYGFQKSPLYSMTLLLSIQHIKTHFQLTNSQ